MRAYRYFAPVLVFGLIACGDDEGPADSGPSDGSILDAGVADAGVSPDSGVVDTGTQDAGVSDSGDLDTGITDAGAADSGLEDSGLEDAGVMDSGTSTLAVTGTWTDATPVVSAGRRLGPVMAFDTTRSRVIMAGGGCFDPNICVNMDVYDWNGSEWTQNAAGQPIPSGNNNSRMVWDSTRNVAFLFASEVTWQWSPQTLSWTMLVNAAGGPGTRPRAGLAYDDQNDRMVLFGGATSASDISNETWAWNGTGWNQLTPTSSPSPRDAVAMVYDGARHQVVMFGGRSDPSAMNRPPCDDEANGVCGGTWIFDGTTWTRANPATSPPPRMHAQMIYDPDRERVVLFGGLADTLNYLNDTWEWDGSNWKQITTTGNPPTTNSFGMAYDQARDVIVIYGGSTGNPVIDEVWELSIP